MPPKTVTPVYITGDPQAHENLHVHAVYDQIAPHFSATRYKPWPIIAQFLSTLPTGFVGLDSGTGNGKYLPLPIDRPPGSVWTIGLDRSRNLLEIARTAGQDDEDTTVKYRREVVWGDVLGKGWRDGVFDYAISIATIHHLATHERRKLAVQRLLQCVSPTHGRVLIYVWAIEQDELSKRNVPNEGNRTDTSISGTGSGQDVFVPWVLSQQNTNKGKDKARGGSRRDPISSNIDSTRSLYDQTGKAPGTPTQDEPQVFNRYYHMFARGELAELVRGAASDLGLYVGAQTGKAIEGGERGLEIVQDGWERSNYYIELRCWRN